MRLVMAAVLAVTLTASATGAARNVALAQCGSAYTDLESAGPGGTYGSPAECQAQAVPVGETREPERDATARDNPDAPPVDRGTATFEGERER